MTVNTSIDPARLLEEQLAQASPDLLREPLATFINTLLSAEADAVCGAEYGTSTPDRVNRRNGYRYRDFAPPSTSCRAVPPPAPAPWTSRSPSSVRGPTSPSGSSNAGSAPSGR